MVNGVWYSVDEALPPLENEYRSVEVIIALKSGEIGKGRRYYHLDGQYWVFYSRVNEDFFNDVETLDDDSVAYWTLLYF